MTHGASHDVFSVLARARSAKDDLPALAVERIRQSGRGFGIDPAKARHGVTTPSGHAIFVVPGDGMVGLYDSSGGGGFSTVEHAASGEMVMVDLCAPGLTGGKVRVYGLLPDGVSDVALVRRSGATTPLQTENNVYAAELQVTGDPPTSVQWAAAGGTTSQAQIPIPPDVAEGHCHAR